MHAQDAAQLARSISARRGTPPRSSTQAHGYFIAMPPAVPPAQVTIMEVASTMVPAPDKVLAESRPSSTSLGMEYFDLPLSDFMDGR